MPWASEQILVSSLLPAYPKKGNQGSLQKDLQNKDLGCWQKALSGNFFLAISINFDQIHIVEW